VWIHPLQDDAVKKTIVLINKELEGMTKKMTSTRQRIEQKLSEREWTVTILTKELAKKTGEKLISQNLHNWMNRDSIPAAYVPALSAILQVNPEWLLTGKAEFLTAATTVNKNQITIPIYKMDVGLNMDEQTITDTLVIDKRWFSSSTGLEPLDTYRMIVYDGDSMQPTINSGDLVLIDIADNEPVDGMAYIHHAGRSEIKRLSASGDVIHVLSDNTRYPAKQYKTRDVQIIGRVRFVFNGRKV
jgi:SOS-response transcriptional repressor LexA